MDTSVTPMTEERLAEIENEWSYAGEEWPIAWMSEAIRELISDDHRLRAEVERYRTALERIAEECCDREPYCPEGVYDEGNGSGHFPGCSARIAWDALHPESTQ